MNTLKRICDFGIGLTLALAGTVNAFGQSILSNPGFESGTAPWQFYTDGAATFTADGSGAGSARAGLVTISNPGSNVQLFQTGFPLETNAQYTLTFKAYANSGHDISVSVQQHTSPYTSYGLMDQYFNLTTSWGTYTIQFKTSGFSGTTTDTRLRIWLAPYDAVNDQYFFDDILLTKATGTSGTQTPYLGTPFSIPGTIQAEAFDNGGEGIAYHDLDVANQGGTYRTSGVDIQGTSDIGGGYNVGWMNAGEWLEYSVNVTTAGTYTIDTRVASSGNGGTFHIDFNGVDRTGPLVIPNTNGWQTWQTVTKPGVALSAGQQIMRIFLDTDGASSYVGNINTVQIGTGGGTAPTIAAQPSNQTVSAGQSATFVVSASGTTPMAFQWQKNSANISGANSASHTTPATTSLDNGSAFRCIVSNSAGSATSSAALLTVSQSAPTGLSFQQRTIDVNNPRNPHCKSIGDIDGDGLIDVLAASSSGYTEGLFWYKYPSWSKYNIHAGSSYSTDMQVGDVDGDGDLDVIIPKGNDYGGSVYWYANPRPGGNPATSTWAENYIGDAGAHDVEVGDINGDGKLDVVVRLGSTVAFFQNSPTSWTKVTLSSRAGEGTAFGDIDADGDLDIAINGYWLENPRPGGNPATTAWVERTVNTGWPSQVAVHIADLNGDGRKDVLLGPSESPTGKLSWYESSSPRTGPWTEHVVDNSAAYLHTFKTADMDRDGDLDIVTAEMHQSSDPDEVSVYRNGGGGLSWTQLVAGTSGSHNIRVGDLGNDGDMDIVGANWNNSAPGGAPITWWENLGGPPAPTLDSWTRRVIDSSKPWKTFFVTAADMNGDGRKDVITGGWWYNNPGTPAGSWTRNTIGSPLNNMAAVYDFDGNGSMDVLGTQGQNETANALFVWARNNGSGSFTILNNVQSGQGDFLQGVAVAQYQGGVREVALSWHQSGFGVQALAVPSDPSAGTWIWRRISTTSQDEQISSGDVDRDGDTDLVLGTQWLRNDGSAWSAFTLNGTGGAPDRNRLADINGDGRIDVVVGFEAISVQGKLAWYEQPASATGTWTEHIVSSTVVGPMSLDLADMDRDGDTDVIVGEHNLSNPASARVLVFENVSNGASWVQHVVFTGEEHHDGAQVVDIDNDGDLDIISIGWNNPNVVLYENRSGGANVSQEAVAETAEAKTAPTTFALHDNFPNPFNPSTTIRYALAEQSTVSLKIYNIIGQEIATLINGAQPAGFHNVRWDGRNQSGSPVTSGMYLYRITAIKQNGEMFSEQRKMVLVK